MKKNNSSFEIHLPSNSSEFIIAALTGEEVQFSKGKVRVDAESLKDLRSRWNTIMRSIEVSHKVSKKLED